MQRARNLVHFYSQNYARYLAGRGPDGGAATARALWAHYKLGRYRTVVQRHLELAAPPDHWRSHVGLAISAAACNQPERMDRAIAQIQASDPSPRLRRTLARGLAAFAPAAALNVLAEQPPSVLQAALLEKTGQREEAIACLDQSRAVEAEASDDLNAILLQANLQATTAEAKLTALNHYLTRFQLEPVGVNQAGAMPCPQTLCSQEPQRHCDGPLVSVIVATYNGAARLQATLHSLFHQTYQSVEIIVIDDCSTDDTSEVVRHLQRQHACLRYRRLPANVGPYVAKSLGMELASGTFVTCHDCDDWSHPRKITAQVQPLLQSRALVATASRWVRLDESGHSYARSTYPLLRLNPSSILFRKADVMSHAGLWDCSRTGADSEFLARIKAVFGRQRVYTLAAPLAIGAHRSNSLMTAASTGMDTGPMHSDRLDYWQAWSDWHISSLANHQELLMPPVHSPRPFVAPEGLRNSNEAIATCLAWWQENSNVLDSELGN